MTPLLLTLALSCPAHAMGVVVGQNDSNPKLVWARGVIAHDEAGERRTTAAAAQVMVDPDGEAWVWLVPLPKGDRSELVRLQSIFFDLLYMSTAPVAELHRRATYTAPACGGEAQFAAMADTGEEAGAAVPIALYWMEPDEDAPNRENSYRVLTDAVPQAIDQLMLEGWQLEPELQQALIAHGRDGGDLLVVKMAAPADEAPAMTDVFAWKPKGTNPTLPVDYLRFQPEQPILLELHLAGAQTWAPSTVDWTLPGLPEVQLLSAEGVLPWWSAQIEQAHDQQRVLHTFGGNQADLITYAEFNWQAFHEQSWLVQEIWGSDESTFGKGVLSFLAYPVILFELMLRDVLFIPGSPFNLTYREDEPDDLFRKMQSEGLLPSGWRNDGKMHMVFHGIFDASTTEPVGVVNDPLLGRVHTEVGGFHGESARGRPTGSGLFFWLPGLLGLGLWSHRRRRATAGGRHRSPVVAIGTREQPALSPDHGLP